MSYLTKHLAALFLTALPLLAQAGSLCEESKGLDRVLCLGTLGVLSTAGAAVVAGESVASALTPRTDVLVELPSGERLNGKATSQLLSSRRLVPGVPLKLRCVASSPAFAGPYGFAACELQFPPLPPRPKSSDYYERTGLQPSWSFGANKDGVLEPMLELERPLKWDAGVGS